MNTQPYSGQAENMPSLRPSMNFAAGRQFISAFAKQFNAGLKMAKQMIQSAAAGKVYWNHTNQKPVG